MIRVVVGDLADQPHEGVMCAIRADRTPVTPESRDVLFRAGAIVTDRLEQMGTLPVGGAYITPAGSLPASFIIHLVTSADDEPETGVSVRRALENGFRRAAEWGIGSVALPAMGLGVGQMEAEERAAALVELLAEHLERGEPPQDLTIVVRGEYEGELFGRLVAGAPPGLPTLD